MEGLQFGTYFGHVGVMEGVVIVVDEHGYAALIYEYNGGSATKPLHICHAIILMESCPSNVWDGSE